MHTPTTSNQKHGTGPLTYYNSAGLLTGIPSCNDIVAEFDNGMTVILQQSPSGKQPIRFMPTEVSDNTSEYVNGISSYILCITGTLINRQKAVVKITGIKPFFDVKVPEEMPLSTFKTRLVNILSNTLKDTSKFGIENISAFPLQGYHTEKKLYIRIITWNQFDQYNALKAVRKVSICTASDDLTLIYYYRKVAWGTHLFQISVNNYNPKSEDDYNNPLFSLALSWDWTLVLTWDIETYSSLRLGKFPTAQSDESNVFMICMSVHWKDDPNPLKQICLVDVKTASDPSWITIICGSQTNLLKAFTLCQELLSPDIQIGFNDSQYDWDESEQSLSASAWRKGVLTSTISERTETESFPDAYVFPPIKGLKNRRPVIGLDFRSLYLSLIMTYNLLPDKIILSQKHAEFLRDSGKMLHEINFKFNGIDVLAWSIRHNNIPEEKGLYAIVLKYLSVKQVEIKKCLAPVKEKKEVMELVMGLMDKDLSLPEAIEHVLVKVEEKNHASLNKNLYHFINKEKHEFMAEYDSVCFEYSCLDAGQNAIKVYMNSFYGTAGDKKCFQECDELYDYGNGIPKEEYWSRMVKISMKEIKKLHDDVNDFLKADNGSLYLKMAYEEVLFPVVFIGKKKYYGIPYESKPNFNKKPFIREVEIVK
ncbi:hypothetical protein RclHR1_21130001 [Rhizophagus clarus]|uniref:DNA polymerase delta catalytic subunit n=1 Tax=Rhizophagus clarus TaxID=94130 RepID=A0A2Z6QRR0_9GLOM|nr:hypothetical protein RclHR1_21130001 [Rhizophagus clarus]